MVQRVGASPKGTPGAIVADRSWDDYSIGRDTVMAHLGALDQVYNGVVAANRTAIEELDKLDLVTQDLLIGQTGELEKFQWFVRAHLENAGGELSTAGETTEQGAAAKADG